MQEQFQKAIDLLSSDFGKQFDSPEFRAAAQRVDAILNDGADGGDLSSEDLYSFANMLFSRELKRGVGDQLPDGSTIAQKRLVKAYEDGDSIILELAITAQRPDGSTFEYEAPVTANRTSEETDEVLRLPVRAVRDRLKGAAMLAKGIEQGGGREAVLQQLGMPGMGMQGVDSTRMRSAPQPDQRQMQDLESGLANMRMGLQGVEMNR